MPANAGIHDFPFSQQGKPWMPAFVGMTRCAAPVGQSFRYLVLHLHPYMIFASNGGTRSGASNSTTQRSGSNRNCRAT
jgi:hypothetical protein